LNGVDPVPHFFVIKTGIFPGKEIDQEFSILRPVLVLDGTEDWFSCIFPVFDEIAPRPFFPEELSPCVTLVLQFVEQVELELIFN
jgi:hypothetical protein